MGRDYIIPVFPLVADTPPCGGFPGKKMGNGAGLRCRRPLFDDPCWSRKFVYAAPERGLGLLGVLRACPDGEDLLALVHPRRGADGLPEGEAHAFRDTVRTCAGRLFVLTEDVVREGPDLQVVVRPPDLLLELPVDADTSGLKRRVPYLACLLNDDGEFDREILGEVAHIKLHDLAARHAAHVFPACICFLCEIPVHLRWFSYHR